ncbi:hypothetical protein CSO01_28990 [Cellulomonas soli]|uniref:Lipoprotein YerB n=1 Tax=Cellulomonas soli TaxID=931535 RepID=A0A512PG61_9CELL|nr:hypothetical protein CSO01_28990 [Cellulomonas soli]
MASLALAACAGPPDAASLPDVTSPAVVTADKQPAPTPVVPARWPLTGVASDAVVERPALAVKIENPREVRPQTGIDQADMVWEQVVEGGVTRFVAVFQSQVPKEVGPIRSVRPMDPAITAPLHGLVAFSGGQAGFVKALSTAGLQLLSNDAGNDGFYRKSGGKPAPHNVFGTPETFWAQADADHSASPQAQFTIARRAEQSTVVQTGTPATTIDTVLSGYAHPSWTWDAASSTWLRTEGTTPATAASGARLAAANVVALKVQLVDSGTVDPAGSPVPETKLVGSGEGVVAVGGRSLAITWSKASTDALLVLTGPDGQPVSLAPGATWIELVPTSSGSITVS